MCKYLCSLLMVLLIGLFSCSLLAQTAIAPLGSGTPGHPFQISSLSNLYWIASVTSNWGMGFVYSQTEDIDATETGSWFGGAGWTPIGNWDWNFFGYYNGNGHRITGLRVNRGPENFCGLFGVIMQNSIIQDLGMMDVWVEGNNSAGAIAGYCSGSILRCYSSGHVAALSQVGGIVGYVWAPDSQQVIQDCYSSCQVQGEVNIAGLVGLLQGWYGPAVVRNCYSTGHVNGYSNNCGALVGEVSNGLVINSYWNIDSANINHSSGGEGRTTTQLTALHPTDTFVGWDFNTVWAIDSSTNNNNGFPYLGNPTPPVVTQAPVASVLEYPPSAMQSVETTCHFRWHFTINENWSNYPRGTRFYLGTDNPPTNEANGLEVGMLNDLMWGPLSMGATYYWKIVPYNEIGEASNCPVDSFTTFSNVLTLNSPNGGEIWMSGTTQQVQWSLNAPPSLDILFSYDNGNNWYAFSTVDGSKQSCYIQVPTVNSTTCRLKIAGTNISSVFDVSDAPFRISTSSSLPKVILTYPSASGITLGVGQTINITWTRQQTTLVNLHYSTDDGITWSSLAQNLNTNTYAWTLPDSCSSRCRIRVSSASNTTVSDVSDNCFSIGKIRLLSPTGGELITGDYSSTSFCQIRWNSFNVTSVKLEYSSNNGSTWTTITAGTDASVGIYSWAVPSTVSSQYRVRISDTSNPLVSDTNATPFSVQVPVAIINANGGGFITNNSLFTIRWRTLDVPAGSFIQWIYAGPNGAYPWYTITGYEGVPIEQGSFDWFVNIGNLSTLILIGRLVGTERIIARSASYITVTDNFLLINEPNGGECYAPGSSQTISWDGWGVSALNISLSTDNGNTWNMIGNNIPASNASFQWIVPNSPSENCRIKLADVSLNYMNLFSDNTFTIVSPPVPATASGLSLMVNQGDMIITWEAVTQDIGGNPMQPDAYIVRYSQEPDAEADEWTILATTSNLQACHPGVANQYERLFYRVTAVKN